MGNKLITEKAVCKHCGKDPGIKKGSNVWNGFYDGDLGYHVCFNCRDYHYYHKTENSGEYLFTEFPVTIKSKGAR